MCRCSTLQKLELVQVMPIMAISSSPTGGRVPQPGVRAEAVPKTTNSAICALLVPSNGEQRMVIHSRRPTPDFAKDRRLILLACRLQQAARTAWYNAHIVRGASCCELDPFLIFEDNPFLKFSLSSRIDFAKTDVIGKPILTPHIKCRLEPRSRLRILDSG